MNLIETLADTTRSPLTWEPAPIHWEFLPGGGIRVQVPPRVDYFRDPAGTLVKDDAPYLWLPVSGDFVACAHVRPSFDTVWDAGALMARGDAAHWAKLCFERTDLGTTAAVSVVTRETSDDANGADLTTPDLWLQLCRRDQQLGLHYSLDGAHWRMVRVFGLSLADPIRIGVVAQCPAGPGTTVDILHFSVENRRVQDLRAGV